MKFPTRFKVFWWIFILLLISYFLYRRSADVVSGHSVPVDVFAFLVWTALLLLPFYSEISFFGMTFKKEIEVLKSQVKDEISGLRAEIRTSVDLRSQINPSFNILAPPPDSQLPEIEKRIQAIVENTVRTLGLRAVEPSTLTLSPDVDFLFKVRYNLEREVRRIWKLRAQGDDVVRQRFVPTLRVARNLSEAGLIDRGIEGAIREVWTVASPAIHGEHVTEAQVSFAREVAPQLIATLKAIG